MIGGLPVIIDNDGDAPAAPIISFTFVDDQEEVKPWSPPQQQPRRQDPQTYASNKDCFKLGVVSSAAGKINIHGAFEGRDAAGATTKTTTTTTAAAAANTRPGTPPPRSLSVFTPTQINITSRRRLMNGVDDEVHPLMMISSAISSSSSNQLLAAPPLSLEDQPTLRRLQEKEVLDDDLKRIDDNHCQAVDLGRTTPGEGNEDGATCSSTRRRSRSVHSSQGTNISSSNSNSNNNDNTPLNNNNNNLHKQIHKKDKTINFKQRLAMENFLSAQSSTDITPIAKEVAWRELVRAMKQADENSIFGSASNSYSRGHAPRSNNSHSRRQGMSSTGRNHKKKDDILGLIRIGGGLKIGAGSFDVVSIASGLTTEQCYDTTTTTALHSSSTPTVDVAAPAAAVNTFTSASSHAVAAGAAATSSSGKVNSNSLAFRQNEERKPKQRAEEESDPSSHHQQLLAPASQGLEVVEATTATWNPDPPSAPGKLVRTVTPPSATFSSRSGVIFPNNILTMAGGLPTVSPLSLDGMFVDDDEEEGCNVLDTADEKDGTRNGSMVDSDIRLRFPMIHEEVEGSSGRKDDFEKKEKEEDGTDNRQDTATKKKSSSLFFDIGESFVDNTKRLLNKDPTKHKNNNSNVVLSLVDSMSEEGGESTTRSGCSEERSMTRMRHQQLPPLLLPSLRNDSSSSVGMFHVPASRSSHGGSTSSDGGFEKMSVWECEMQKQVGASSSGSSRNKIPNTGSLSIIAHSNEGEIVSFHEITEHSVKISKPIPQQSMALEQKDIRHQLSQSLASNSPRRLVLLPRREQNSFENGQNSSTCERSAKRRPRRRGAGGNNNISTAPSLEEQILNVLQQQPESYVVGDTINEKLQLGGALDSSSNNKSSRVKNGTVGSAASAQDILRELRSSISLHNESSLNNSCNRSSSKLPLGSVSIGTSGLHLGLDSIASQQHNICFTSEKHFDENGGILRPHTPSLALNPSPRDIPRPSRSRRSVSDSTPATSAAKAVVSTTFPPSSMVANTRPGGAEPLKSKSRSASGPANVKSSDSMSPLERYCKAIGTDAELVSAKNSRLRGRIFPHTSPITSDVTGQSSRMQSIPRKNSTNPFDDPSTNPFDSPSRSLPFPKAKEPFSEQSSPIPMERSGDTDISQDASGSQHNTYSSEEGVLHGNESEDTSKSIPCQRDSPPSVLLLKPPKLDTIRSRRSPPSDWRHSTLGGSSASKSQLLVRGEEISRFLAQEVGDNRFVDEDENNVEEEKVLAAEARRNICVNDVERSAQQTKDLLCESLKTTSHYQWREDLANATVMDDDVVEDAVRAATEYLSTTSMSSNDTSTINEVEQTEQLPVGENEEENEFSVISTHQRSAYELTVDIFDNFDISPSESMDEWGGANRWGFDEDDHFENDVKGNMVYFSSPTSVATGNYFS